MFFYSVRDLGDYLYRVVKFDIHHNVEEIYDIYRAGMFGRWYCSCTGSSRYGHCKHSTIVTLFVESKRINKGWFYNFDLEVWERPLNDPIRWIQQQRREL